MATTWRGWRWRTDEDRRAAAFGRSASAGGDVGRRRKPFVVQWAVAMLLVASIGSPARAGDIEDASAALARGDCVGAGAAINAGLARQDADAYLLAGFLYESTDCVDRNTERAAHLYQLAVEHGNEGARKSLGMMYALGRGVPQDYVIANYWYHYPSEPKPPDATTDVPAAAANGYVQTLMELARTGPVQRMQARLSGQERDPLTVMIVFTTGDNSIAFDDDSPPDGPGGKPLNKPRRPEDFRAAIREGLEDAMHRAPKLEGPGTAGRVFRLPVTFSIDKSTR